MSILLAEWSAATTPSLSGALHPASVQAPWRVLAQQGVRIATPESRIEISADGITIQQPFAQSGAPVIQSPPVYILPDGREWAPGGQFVQVQSRPAFPAPFVHGESVRLAWGSLLLTVIAVVAVLVILARRSRFLRTLFAAGLSLACVLGVAMIGLWVAREVRTTSLPARIYPQDVSWAPPPAVVAPVPLVAPAQTVPAAPAVTATPAVPAAPLEPSAPTVVAAPADSATSAIPPAPPMASASAAGTAAPAAETTAVAATSPAADPNAAPLPRPATEEDRIAWAPGPDATAVAVSELPAWTQEPVPERLNYEQPFTLSSSRFSTMEEAEAELTERLRQLVTELFQRQTGISGEWRPDAALLARFNVIGERCRERSELVVGSFENPIYRVHWRGKLPSGLLDEMLRQWRPTVVTERVSIVGGLIALLSLALGGCSLLLRGFGRRVEAPAHGPAPDRPASAASWGKAKVATFLLLALGTLALLIA